MSLCLLCNASPLEASPAQDGRVWLKSIHVLGKLFDVDLGTSPLVTSASVTSNPYCSKCTKKVKHLNQLCDQLETIQKRIEAYQKEIGQTIVQTFPSTANRGTLYQWKHRIFEKVAGHKQTDRRNEPVEIAIYPGSGTWTGPAATIHVTNYSVSSTSGSSYALQASPEYFHGEGASDLIGEEVTIQSGTATPTPASPAKRIKTKLVKIGGARGDKLKQDVMQNQKTQCEYCSRVFSSSLNLSRHITIHTDDKPYSCSYCSRTFRDSSNKARHERNVHTSRLSETRPYCNLCDKSFLNKDSLYDHKRYQHLGFQKSGRILKPSECKICGKVMNNRKNLLRHINVQHKLQFTTYYCPICGRPAKQSKDIKEHLETHKSVWERELEGKTFFYKCSTCTQSFPSKAKLQDHQSFEHPEVKIPPIKKIESKPHTCKYCPDRPGFANLKDLRAHIQVEHPSMYRKNSVNNGEPRPVKRSLCQICSKPCKDNWHAKQHELTHDPERNAHFPLVCPKCPPISGMFSRKEDFVVHYETEHPKCSIPKVTPRNTKKES